MRGHSRNFGNTQSEKTIMGSACSPILLVLLITLSSCIVSFSSESVPIHSFYSQRPPLIKNHNGAMHTGRCSLGMRVAQPLVHASRLSI